MPDEADIGADEHSYILSGQLHKIRSQAGKREAEPVGHCQNPACEADFEPGSPKIYCDANCAAEHARIKARGGNE